MKTLFISDLHLDNDTPALTDFFFNFIDHIAVHSDRLFILGDFFEVWIGDDEQTELQVKVADKLSELASSGVLVFLMHGNRDFLIGEHYAKQCQATLIHEPWLLTLGDKKVVLMHGDTLCTDDRKYLQFRSLVRNPQWQQQTLSTPLENRKLLASQLRQMSKHQGLEKSGEIMDVAQETVREVIDQHQVDILLHGHTHRPAEHSVTTRQRHAKRIVLGDWTNSTWYAIAENQHLELKKINADDCNSIGR